jgi:phosphoserine phosphatase RsbU/P
VLTQETHEHDGEAAAFHSGGTANRLRQSAGALPRRTLRAQLQRAARVQRSLLPDLSEPVGAFGLTSLYWPCHGLGGDLYDLALRQDCAVLLVADVMGHGLEAALIAMLVKAAFLEASEATGEPCELLVRMNARLRRLLPSRVYVAAAVARLALGGAGIRLANAGLPHPFLLHASERRVEELELNGRPLGLFEERPETGYRVLRLTLGSGDVLLLSSDGIGCIEGAAGECFEDCRLRQTLAEVTGQEGPNVIDRLAAQAVEFSRGRPLPDDVNLIAVSRNGHRLADSGGRENLRSSTSARPNCQE